LKALTFTEETKHSTITALRKKYSPEEIKKRGSGHKTNKAFARYFTIDDDDSRLLYADALSRKLRSSNGKLL
jgi:hypothetical protein